MSGRHIIFIAALLLGCETRDGSGSVEATFFVDDCPPGTELNLSDYRFDAGWLATERYAGVLIIQVQEYRVRIEETDSAAVLLDLTSLIEEGTLVADENADEIRRADEATPLVLPLVPEGGFANASLSLFQTCPNFPTLHATSGTVELTEFVLAIDPEDTGRGERLAGTFTATVARSVDLADPAGTTVGVFDFAPPRRPTVTFK